MNDRAAARECHGFNDFIFHVESEIAFLVDKYIDEVHQVTGVKRGGIRSDASGNISIACNFDAMNFDNFTGSR